MSTAYAAIVKQKEKRSLTAEGFSINSFTVDFIQPYSVLTCESGLVSFPDGTSWTLTSTHDRNGKLNFSVKYFGEQSVLASTALKITSKCSDKSIKEMNKHQNIDITTVHQYDPARKNMITGPNVLVSYALLAQCILITVAVSIQVRREHFFMDEKKSVSDLSSHSLHKDLTEMLHKERATDLVLVAVMRNGDLVKTPVHKFVLCARSAVFLTMFENRMQESQTNEIVITDATAEIVNEFVSYLYSDTCQITPENVVALLQMAHKYAVRGLVELCESELLKGLAVQNVVDLLVLSETYELVALKRAGIVLFAQNYTQVKALREVDLNAGVLSAKLLCEILGHVVSR